MITTAYTTSIALAERLSGADFFRDYVKPGKPVLMKGRLREWEAVRKWSPAYFAEKGGRVRVLVKEGDVSEGRRAGLLLGEYVSELEAYEQAVKRGEAAPGSFPYLHDVPIFHLLPAVAGDVEPFPLAYFPGWYHRRILRFAQFFMSATGSRTPLHFDTLYTHNLFFQIYGRKKFILIPGSQKQYCYLRGWRWSEVNAGNPDLGRHPLFRKATSVEVTVEPGDVLFIPAGTLHEVVSLDPAISFNIDWHTVRTAWKGVRSGLEGAPRENVYYNSLIALGLSFRIPSDWIFPLYRSYLSYIS